VHWLIIHVCFVQVTILNIAWRSRHAHAPRCAHFPIDIWNQKTSARTEARDLVGSATHCHLDKTNMDKTSMHMPSICTILWGKASLPPHLLHFKVEQLSIWFIHLYQWVKHTMNPISMETDSHLPHQEQHYRNYYPQIKPEYSYPAVPLKYKLHSAYTYSPFHSAEGSSLSTYSNQ